MCVLEFLWRSLAWRKGEEAARHCFITVEVAIVGANERDRAGLWNGGAYKETGEVLGDVLGNVHAAGHFGFVFFLLIKGFFFKIRFERVKEISLVH